MRERTGRTPAPGHTRLKVRRFLALSPPRVSCAVALGSESGDAVKQLCRESCERLTVQPELETSPQAGRCLLTVTGARLGGSASPPVGAAARSVLRLRWAWEASEALSAARSALWLASRLVGEGQAQRPGQANARAGTGVQIPRRELPWGPGASPRLHLHRLQRLASACAAHSRSASPSG